MKFSKCILDNPQSTRLNAKQLTGWQLADGVEDAELTDYVAFIYRITLKDGSTYCGRKKLWRLAGPKAPSLYPKKKFNMSDWLFYNTSSNVNRSTALPARVSHQERIMYARHGLEVPCYIWHLNLW